MSCPHDQRFRKSVGLASGLGEFVSDSLLRVMSPDVIRYRPRSSLSGSFSQVGADEGECRVLPGGAGREGASVTRRNGDTNVSNAGIYGIVGSLFLRNVALGERQPHPSWVRRASSMPKWCAISWMTVMSTSSTTWSGVSHIAQMLRR